MAKSLSELKDRGFIPTPLLERMAATEPGQLAALVDQLLYDGDVRDVQLSPDGKTTAKHFTVSESVYCSARKGGDDNRHDVRKGLVSVRDYLEACALKESAR